MVWTDDFDGVGTDLPIMEEIMNACHKNWAVKQTSNEYMVGVQRKFQTNPDGTQVFICGAFSIGTDWPACGVY